MRDIPYWARKSLWSLTKRSASDSSPAGADDSAGSADEVVLGSSLATSEAEAEAEAVGSADALTSTDEAGSRDAEAVGSGAKMSVLTDEVGTAEAEASTLTLALAETETEAEAEGRAQARFFATGEAMAGAARARTGRIVKRAVNFIVNVMLVFVTGG